jgi:ubiquitin-conjugating enzyme E2 variant
MSQPPPVVQRLQRWGLILSQERHALHHADHQRAFCVTSGWLNPLLDRIRFFPRIERAVRALVR